MIQLDLFIPYLLRRVVSQIDFSVRPELRAAGLTLEYWRVLVVLDEKGPLSLTELADYVSINRSTLSRIVDRMVTERLIDRAPSGINRAISLSINKLGCGKISSIEPLAESLNLAIEEEFSKKEQREIRKTLTRMFKAYSKVRYRKRANSPGSRGFISEPENVTR
ncbi:MarR family winged helix-turn-helix transcriptional regulator [Hyphococcus sp.]|uniref:MarR family winged helix-turn-helix transcriptional regulator n=1 Tax=Hyphococcus sp. TaxID=2038636 RepID=UPI0035C6F9CA